MDGNARQQHHADHPQQGADNRKHPILTGTADNPPANDRGQQQAAHQRDQLQARLGRRRLFDHLQIERQEGHRAEQRHADNKANQAAQQKAAVAKQGERNNRLAGQPLFMNKADDPDQAKRQDAPELRVAPRADAAALGGKQDDAQQRHAEVNRPQPVDLVLAALVAAVKNRTDHQQRKQPQRQVDVKNPAPGGVLYQETAD